MSEPPQHASGAHVSCKICKAETQFFDRVLVLRKHPVEYFRCPECRFIQTEAPYWLDDAYSNAIARQDVGIMVRNLLNVELASAVLALVLPEASRFLDYGGGHGVFVRLMRDRGFNFFWSDLYASNDYARGFERGDEKRFDAVTAFEVLEHLVDPLDDLAPMMELSDNVFVSTILVPEPAPKVADWWYYTPTSGQHVSLYTPKALQLVAAHFGRQVLSHGAYHLFTRQPKSDFRFQLATRPRIARVLNRMLRRKSLMERDHREMIS